MELELNGNTTQLLHADLDETRHPGRVPKNITHIFFLAAEIGSWENYLNK